MNTLASAPSNFGHLDNPVVCLTGKQIKSLHIRRNAKHFHVIEGRAWVTYDDNDVIVESGETIAIPASRHRIIISPTSVSSSICYQLS